MPLWQVAQKNVKNFVGITFEEKRVKERKNEKNGAFIFLNQILPKNFQKTLDKPFPLW